MKAPTGIPLVVQWLRLCAFPLQGTQVQSLAGELRSFMLSNVAKKVIKTFLFKKRKDQQREGVGQNEGSRRTKRKGSTQKGRKERNSEDETEDKLLFSGPASPGVFLFLVLCLGSTTQIPHHLLQIDLLQH